MKKMMYKKAGKKMSKGGAKPDYLDMDGDGNKKESMKSAIKSKKKMGMGGKKMMSYKKGGMKKMMGGGTPAQSFIEPPMERPFDSKSEFVAQSGGERMKDLRKKQREERKTARKNRRADRKADREAVRTLKKSSRKARKAKPFKDGAGPIVEMSRGEKREDRRATNKAARAFKKQERKARRTSRKEMKAGQKSARQEQRGQNRIGREEQKNKKLNTLNKSESSSVKPVIKKKKTIDPKEVKKTAGKIVKNVAKKVVEKSKEQSFGDAFKTNRAAGKKEFTWKGKRYHTRTKEEEAKKNKKEPVGKTTESKRPKGFPQKNETVVERTKRQMVNPYAGPKYKRGGRR